MCAVLCEATKRLPAAIKTARETRWITRQTEKNNIHPAIRRATMPTRYHRCGYCSYYGVRLRTVRKCSPRYLCLVPSSNVRPAWQRSSIRMPIASARLFQNKMAGPRRQSPGPAATIPTAAAMCISARGKCPVTSQRLRDDGYRTQANKRAGVQRQMMGSNTRMPSTSSAKQHTRPAKKKRATE